MELFHLQSSQSLLGCMSWPLQGRLLAQLNEPWDLQRSGSLPELQHSHTEHMYNIFQICLACSASLDWSVTNI